MLSLLASLPLAHITVTETPNLGIIYVAGILTGVALTLAAAGGVKHLRR